MIATVDSSCISCGVCPDICPEAFKIGDDGLAEFYIDSIPDEIQDRAIEAADSCPVNAIQIEK